jgi:hypothetical protein
VLLMVGDPTAPSGLKWDLGTVEVITDGPVGKPPLAPRTAATYKASYALPDITHTHVRQTNAAWMHAGLDCTLIHHCSVHAGLDFSLMQDQIALNSTSCTASGCRTRVPTYVGFNSIACVPSGLHV